MIYLALLSFTVAMALVGLDVTGLAPGAGGATNILLLLCLAATIGHAVTVYRHHYHRHS